jgi:hypothetical protein
LPNLGFGRVVLLKQVDELAHTWRPQSACREFPVRLFDFGVVALNEALSLKRQNVGDRVLAIQPKGQGVVAGASWAALSGSIGIIGLAGENALVDFFQMLEFLIMYAEEKRKAGVARQSGWEGSDNQDEKPSVAAQV